MRLNWSTHPIAVVGSFTAGEIALSAMSTICRTPNSMSCCNVREGPKSNAARNAAAVLGGKTFGLVHHQQRSARRNELANPASDANFDLVGCRER